MLSQKAVIEYNSKTKLFDFSAFIADKCDSFAGRKWIFRQIREWQRKSDAPRFLIITGEQGIGKSAIAAQIVDKGKELDIKVDCHHFCSFAKVESVEPIGFTHFLGAQLAMTEPGYVEALRTLQAEKLATAGKGGIFSVVQNIKQMSGTMIGMSLFIQSDQSWKVFTEQIRAPLQLMAKKGNRRRFTIVVDSMDEAMLTQDPTPIPKLLENYGSDIENARWILTTRPDAGIVELFKAQKVPFIEISATNPNNRKDIRNYIKSQVTRSSKSKNIRSALTKSKIPLSSFIDRAAEKSSGNFLYVHYLLQAAAKGEKKITSLEDLPDGLDDFYRQDLQNRIFGSDNLVDTAIKSVLAILSVYREPLSKSILIKFSGESPEQITQALLKISQYLEPRLFDNERYQIHHSSLIRLLLDGKKAGKVLVVDALAWHGIIAENYLRFATTEWSECDDYGIRFLPYHLFGAGKTQRLSVLLLDYCWINKKLARTDINTLLADYAYTQNERACVLVEKALRLSGHVLQLDKNELASQLTARLCGHEETSTVVANFLENLKQIKKVKKELWIKPNRPTMAQSGGPLIETFEGHSKFVTSVSVHPGFNWALSGSFDKTLKLWDLAKCTCIKTFEGHSNCISSVVIHPDGKRALSGSYDNTMKLWNLANGKCIMTLFGHSKAVTSISIHHKGKRALSGSWDNTMKLWDLAKGTCVKTIEGHCDSITSVVIDKSGKRALSGSVDKTLKLWNLSKGTCIKTIEGHCDSVTSVAINHSGKRALSGSVDKTLKLWNLAKGRCIRTFKGHSDSVNSVVICKDGKQAFSGSWDKTLKLWNLQNGECIRTFEGHSFPVNSISLNMKENRAFSGADDKTLKLWDINGGERIKTPEKHLNWVYSVVIDPNGKQALSGSGDNTMKLWDLASGECIKTLGGHSDWVYSVAVCPDGNRALSGSRDNSLKLWDLANGECVKTLEGHSGWVRSVAVCPDGNRAISGSHDNTLKLWDLTSGKCIKTLEGHSNSVTSVAIDPAGRWALCGFSDNTLKQWDIANGRCIRTFKGHCNLVDSVAISPNDKWALSGSADGTLKLWNIANGRCIRTFKGHCDRIASVAVLPNGQEAISGSYDNTLKLWNLQTGICTLTLNMDAPVICCAINLADSLIVAGDSIGKIHFFHLENHPCHSPILTPCRNPKRKTLAYHCPFCVQWISINESQLGKLITCPGSCKKELVLNSFFAEAEWEEFANARKDLKRIPQNKAI
jgi:WD40 repeat protein